MRVKLAVADRLQFAGFIPEEGNFLDLTLRNDILNKVSLTQKEIADWEVKPEGNNIRWSAEKAKDIDIEFTDSESEFLRSKLEKLNETNKLSPQTFNLYKLFVVDKDSKNIEGETKTKK